jgi:hypothetical protein
MTVKDLLKIVRARLRDIKGTDSQKYWADWELIDDYSEEARTDLFTRVKGLVIDSSTANDGSDPPLPICVIPLVAGQGLYPVSSKVIAFKRVQTNTGLRPLRRMTMAELDAHNPNWLSLDPGEPYAYCPDYQTDALLLVPPPQVDGTATATVSRYPLSPLTYTSDATLGFREEYHKDLIPKILALAFDKKDGEIYNPQLSATYEAKFAERCDKIAIEVYRKNNGTHTNRYRP